MEAVCKEIGGVRYVLKLLEVMRCAGGHVLCAVSAGGRCALCAGGCEGRAACAVGAGGCALLAGGCALRAGGREESALYAGVSDRRATCACWKCKCWRLCSICCMGDRFDDPKPSSSWKMRHTTVFVNEFDELLGLEDDVDGWEELLASTRMTNLQPGTARRASISEPFFENFTVMAASK